MKKNKRKKFNCFCNNAFPLLIFVATLLMGIGYASVSSITLDIEGTLVAKAQDGVFISAVNYVKNSGADLNSSEIINCYETMMNSKVVLSTTSGTSSITYKVKVYNNTNSTYYFDEVVYDPSFYSNPNITYKIEGIIRGSKLVGGTGTEFNITFYYLNNKLPNTTISNYNVLNSYLNFVFTPENEMADYNVTDSPALLLKKSFTTGNIASIGADRINGSESAKFKIDPERGLYINDDSTSANYWLFFSFLADDGYTSTLNPDHFYYLRAKNWLIKKDTSTGFAFLLANALHPDKRHFGAASSFAAHNGTPSNNYVLLSALSKPPVSKDAVDGQYSYAGDYVDSIQLGSSAAALTESYTKDFMFIDITELFGVGNEPSKEWLDSNLIFDNDSIIWFAV